GCQTRSRGRRVRQARLGGLNAGSAAPANTQQRVALPRAGRGAGRDVREARFDHVLEQPPVSGCAASVGSDWRAAAVRNPDVIVTAAVRAVALADNPPPRAPATAATVSEPSHIRASRNQVRRASPWLRTGPTPSVSSRIAARRPTYASAESSPTFNPNARAIWDGASQTLRP